MGFKMFSAKKVKGALDLVLGIFTSCFGTAAVPEVDDEEKTQEQAAPRQASGLSHGPRSCAMTPCPFCANCAKHQFTRSTCSEPADSAQTSLDLPRMASVTMHSISASGAPQTPPRTPSTRASRTSRINSPSALEQALQGILDEPQDNQTEPTQQAPSPQSPHDSNPNTEAPKSVQPPATPPPKPSTRAILTTPITTLVPPQRTEEPKASNTHVNKSQPATPASPVPSTSTTISAPVHSCSTATVSKEELRVLKAKDFADYIELEMMSFLEPKEVKWAPTHGPTSAEKAVGAVAKACGPAQPVIPTSHFVIMHAV